MDPRGPHPGLGGGGLTALVQVVRPPLCGECGTRCGKVDHWPDHWLASCRRKVTHLTPEGAIAHAQVVSRPAFVYECPLSPRAHYHVASGRFHGWGRPNTGRS